MGRWKYSITILFLIIVNPVLAQTSAQLSETPPNFKIAFIGDQGLGKDAEAVLRLSKSEGAQAVLHQGDLDSENNPAAWDTQINKILGADFPYFVSIGNHDTNKWYGKNGYQQYLKNRLNQLDIKWEGDLGVKSSIRYKGIFIILVAPGIWGSGYDNYIRDQLAADRSIWKICSWHKNMHLMQVCNKRDSTGWGVYEESRKGGAIIATAHNHAYGHTYPMSSFVNQTIASNSNPIIITKGITFAFFSGLGGRSIHSQELNGPWWAKIYTKTQHATYGALLGVFNVNGDPNKATFYFKNIKGNITDYFDVMTNICSGSTTVQKRL